MSSSQGMDGGVNAKWLLTGYKVFWDPKRSWNCREVAIAQYCESTGCHWIKHFKMVNCVRWISLLKGTSMMARFGEICICNAWRVNVNIFSIGSLRSGMFLLTFKESQEFNYDWCTLNWRIRLLLNWFLHCIVPASSRWTGIIGNMLVVIIFPHQNDTCKGCFRAWKKTAFYVKWLIDFISALIFSV